MSTRPVQDGEVFFLSIPFHSLCYSNVTPSPVRPGPAAPRGLEEPPLPILAVVVLVGDEGRRHGVVAFVQAHDPHALGGPALAGNVVHRHADHNPFGADEHDLIAVPHHLAGDDGTVLLGDLQGADALAAPSRD